MLYLGIAFGIFLIAVASAIISDSRKTTQV
jgi:hypothetical protein